MTNLLHQRCLPLDASSALSEIQIHQHLAQFSGWELRDGSIEYVPMPPALEGRYQSFTEADVSRLRAAGYTAPMLGVGDGVRRYVEWLISNDASAA
jgi:nucleoside-diphosphate-sugar epimerase